VTAIQAAPPSNERSIEVGGEIITHASSQDVMAITVGRDKEKGKEMGRGVRQLRCSSPQGDSGADRGCFRAGFRGLSVARHR